MHVSSVTEHEITCKLTVSFFCSACHPGVSTASISPKTSKPKFYPKSTPKSHLQNSITSTTTSPPSMEEQEDEKALNNLKPNSFFPSPTLFLTNFLSFQAEIISNCLLALLSPLFTILYLISAPEETKENVKLVVHTASQVPSKLVRCSFLLIRKVGFGILAAVYVGLILTVVLVVSFVLGFGLVHIWVEEPVSLTERLHFDYSLVNPEAVFSFGDNVYRFDGGYGEYDGYGKVEGVPVGHSFYVSLVLLLPESDYNREIGVFQLNAELITSNGAVMAKSSRPCMLHFSSWPVRIMRTFTMSIPLLLGIKSETQTLTVPMIKHKEGYPRTEAVRITMVPRPGTDYIPQVYEAELVLKSRPPWKKELVRRWRWTCSIWASFYIFTVILVVLLFYCRQLVLPVMTRDVCNDRQDYAVEEVSEKEQKRPDRTTGIRESLRRWQLSRRRRRAILERGVAEHGGSSASSTSVTKEDTGTSTFDEGTADSESVCCSGVDD